MGKTKWTQAMLDRLGKEPDSSIAKIMGVSNGTVAIKRKDMGIPRFSPKHGPRKSLIDWTLIDPLLGTKTDASIAKEFGTAHMNVANRRRVLGIKSFRKSGAPRMWTEEELSLLGKIPVSEFAARFKVNARVVYWKMGELGISMNSIPERCENCPEWVMPLLGKFSDLSIADAAGVSREYIRQLRSIANIDRPAMHEIARRALKTHLDAQGIEHKLEDVK
jgi:hypothetical protein